MIKPHYIELNLETIYKLIQHLPVSESTFMDLLKDSRKDKETFYIYHHRMNENGLPFWVAVTPTELKEHYLGERDIDPESKIHFIKL